MNKNIIIGVIVVIVVVLVGIGVFSNGDDEALSGSTETETEETKTTVETVQEQTEEIFNKVPSFALNDYSGSEVTPNDFEGKILVVNSWATWCPFCINELPDFVELQEVFPDDIVVIAIDRSESLTQVRSYTDDRLNITSKLIFLLDPSDSFYRSIGGFSMPETLFVDTEGNIRIHKRGPMDFSEMKEKVESILNS